MSDVHAEVMVSVETALLREMNRLPAPLVGPCRRLAGAGGERRRPGLFGTGG